jgi:hypothetical protein
MEIKVPNSTAPRPTVAKVKDAKKGTITLLEETRLAENQTKESINLIQVQDGIWKTRWGRAYYGNAIADETNLDAAFEYIKNRGRYNEERQIIVFGSSGVVYKSVNNGHTWNSISGATLSGGTSISAVQIEEQLYIANGVDRLVRYDGSTLHRYDALLIPTGLNLTLHDLTPGSFNAYYQVTALNEVGETPACSEVSIKINKERDTWTNNESIELRWNAVPGALRYQIYYSDDSGYEEHLSSTTTNSYIDDGSDIPNPYIVAPISDTTEAPRFKHLELSGGRIWGTNDPDNPHIVYFSGVGQFIGFFSSYYGGGWVNLEYGGREICVGVTNYRTGKGDEVATVLTRTPEGTGSIWQIALDVATSGDLSFTLPVPSKIVDYIGCTSHNAIVKAGDKVFFPNINGIFDLGNKEQMYNILVSAETSQAIRPDYRALDARLLENMVGYYYDAKLFFSASVNGEKNDIIFIYDIERKSWNYYWDFGVNNFFETTDDSFNHHFVYTPTSGNRLVEISDKFSTDFNGAFRTLYVSGLFSFDDRMDAFAKVYQGIIEFGHLKGTVTFEILGIERIRGFRSQASRVYRDTYSTIDFTNTLWGDYMFSTGVVPPGFYAQSTSKKRLRINKRLNRIQFKVSSVSVGTQYSILGVQANGRGIAMNPPNIWRN